MGRAPWGPSCGDRTDRTERTASGPDDVYDQNSSETTLCLYMKNVEGSAALLSQAGTYYGAAAATATAAAVVLELGAAGASRGSSTAPPRGKQKH